VARTKEIERLESRIAELDAERDSLARHVQELRDGNSGSSWAKLFCSPEGKSETGYRTSPISFPDAPLWKKSPEPNRISFFLELFHARTDVHAERFESRKTGKSGYQPVCANIWIRPICQKPKIRCHQCTNRLLVPLSDSVIRQHLAGNITVGIYPMLPAETCHLLAVDFDKDGWQEDALAFLRICREQGVPAALERSRSGRGGHVWIFFDDEIAARAARQMGAALITKAMPTRPSMGLDSYDRLFPNQDNMPKGGFGNLIALPLQRGPAQNGNSLFVDDNFRVFADQWAYLSTLQRMSVSRAQELAKEARGAGKIIGVRPVTMDEGQEDPWTLPPSRRKHIDRKSNESVPDLIRAVLSDEIYVPKDRLPPSLLNEVVRVAAFQNPEFYRAQAMRLPVFGKPRVIGCASDNSKYIGLPRGCMDDLDSLMAAWGVELRIDDRRFSGNAIDVNFTGELRASQSVASKAVLKHDFGVLAASTAFGKTVVATQMLAKRGTNTLVLVHRRQLMDQWAEQLNMFLDANRSCIGCIGGGKRNPTGIIDVAVMQSLCRKGEVDDLVAEYGHVIVDECHHVSARSFELITRRCRPRYILGLSATAIRKDGHHPIVFMQCGPIRYRVNERDEAARRPFSHTVEVIHTEFQVTPKPTTDEEPEIQEIFRLLVEDADRNNLIAKRALSALECGRSPVLLTERKKHLEWFREYFEDKVECLVALHGGMGVRQRRAAWETLRATAVSGVPRLVVATGKYLGEGFDDARLDTLLLAMPVSWKGTVAQYAGRLHRLFAGKQKVMICDFLDESVPVLVRMFERRKTGYAAIGYSLEQPPE